MTTPRDCPCCGGPGMVKAGQKNGSINAPVRGWVGCPECGLYIQWVHDPGGAIAKWNRRAGTAQPYDLLREEGGVGDA